MWWCKKNWHKDEVKSLEQDLQKLGSIQFDQITSENLRQRLLYKVQHVPVQERYSENITNLVATIQKVVRKTGLPWSKRLVLKQRLLAFIQRSDVLQLAFGSFRRRNYLKSLMASFLLFCLMLTTILVWPFHVPVSLAVESTYIDEADGDVFVLRDGDSYPAKINFQLQEGDTVVTKDKSFATIRFFDDSTSRLAQNTQLELTRLYTQPFNQIATQVEVLLKEGRLWTRVLNLVDEHALFVVNTKDVQATVTKRAAFDLEQSSNSSTVAVFDNVVDISTQGRVKNYLSLQPQPVLAGFKAEFDHGVKVKTTMISALSKTDQGNDVSNLWVETNLQRDKVHAVNLVNKNEINLTGSDGMTNLLTAKQEPDVKVFSNPEIDQLRQDFLQDYQDLQLGETMLLRNQNREGMKLILRFYGGVQTLMMRMADFDKKDPVNASLLRSFVAAKIGEQRKNLATFLPGDLLYQAKEIVEDAQLFLADNSIDRTLLELSQAEDKLFEIQGVAFRGQIALAERLLARYEHQIKALVVQLNDADLQSFQEKMILIFHQQVNQIKALTNIEKSFDSVQKDFLLHVQKVRQSLLGKLVKAFEVMPNAVSVSVIKELKDFLQIYISESVHDDDFIEMLNQLLVNNGEQDLLGLITQTQQTGQNIPVDLGIVQVIREGQATPAVSTVLPK